MIETKEHVLDRASFLKIYRSEALKTMKPMFIGFLLIVLFVIGISVYGYILSGTMETLISWLPFLVIYFFILAFVYWICPASIYKDKKNQYSFTKRKYRFFDDHLECETEEGVKFTMPFSVLRIEAGKDYFALWYTSLTVAMVPFSAFESDGDIEAVSKVLGID